MGNLLDSINSYEKHESLQPCQGIAAADISDPGRFMNESELQKVTQISKDIVFGYIRQQSLNTIPKLVTVVILAFYTDDTDEFDIKHCGERIKITNDIIKLQHI